LNPMQVLSIWLCVDDSDRNNGCVQYASKSHLEGLKTFGMNGDAFGKHVNEIHQGKASKFDFDPGSNEVIYSELKSGDVALHHPFLFHSSNENFSDRRRCGLTIRYISTSTQIGQNNDNGEQEGSCYLARGNIDPEVANDYFQIPEYEPSQHFSLRNL